MKKIIYVLIFVFVTTTVFTKQAEKPSIKLYVFDCGRLMFNNLDSFGIKNDAAENRELSVPCIVIEHEKGRLLWEGGLPSYVSKSGAWIEMDNNSKMRLDKTLNQQLSEINLSLNDIDFVAFSHFHFDHVGIANEIKRAKLILQRLEYEAAFENNVSDLGYYPELYEELKESEKIIIDGNYDVFGDSTVIVLSAPGHTRGHQVLFVNLPETGPILLSGDLYHFNISRKLKSIPTFNVDSIQTRNSMDKIEEFILRTKSKLWIQHDINIFNKLKKSPNFYK